MFGTFIGCISGYRISTISNPTKLYHVDNSRGSYRYHPIHFRPLSSTIDYLSIETFQQRCSLSMWSQQFAITYSKRINHKNYNILNCDWLKKLLFPTNSLAKLLSDSLLLDSLLSDSFLSDSSANQSNSKL